MNEAIHTELLFLTSWSSVFHESNGVGCNCKCLRFVVDVGYQNVFAFYDLHSITTRYFVTPSSRNLLCRLGICALLMLQCFFSSREGMSAELSQEDARHPNDAKQSTERYMRMTETQLERLDVL